MLQLHERLRKIVEASGLSQTAFAEKMGISLASQKNYEKGLRSPDSKYIERLHLAGYDAMYVITGEANTMRLSREDSELLAVWHAADLARKTAAYNALVGNVPVPGVEIKKEYKFEGDFAVGENHGVILNNDEKNSGNKIGNITGSIIGNIKQGK